MDSVGRNWLSDTTLTQLSFFHWISGNIVIMAKINDKSDNFQCDSSYNYATFSVKTDVLHNSCVRDSVMPDTLYHKTEVPVLCQYKLFWPLACIWHPAYNWDPAFVSTGNSCSFCEFRLYIQFLSISIHVFVIWLSCSGGMGTFHVADKWHHFVSHHIWCFWCKLIFRWPWPPCHKSVQL